MMKVYYYALPEYIGVLLGHNYFKSTARGYNLRLMQCCDRVWEQDPTGKITLIKHRHHNAYDADEFVNVKISSTELTHELFHKLDDRLMGGRADKNDI